MEIPSPWNSSEIKENKLIFFKNYGDEEYGLDELLGSQAEVLGKGTFGRSYKAYLENKRKSVAVKRLKKCLSENEFKEKVEELGKIDHENLLPLLAYCSHRIERILVYEYMNRGSLAFVLHGIGGVKKSQLAWQVRCGIIYGVSRGITYLHARGPNVCHGNIRSSNVLLTFNYNARLSDYGISQLVTLEPKTTMVAGYCAPEVQYAREVSQKSDVYSFGVLLLEILTGKPPIGAISEIEGIEDLPKWVRIMLQEKPILDMIDVALAIYKEQAMEEQMMELLQLAICCTFQNPSKRPSMAAVTNQIQETCKFAVETGDTYASVERLFQSLEGF